MLSATEAAAKLARGELTSEKLMQQCLERSAALEPEVGAWETLDGERALNDARTADRDFKRGARRGLLHGIPIGVKDIIDVAGLPTRFGTPIYRNHVADGDAACVALAKAAGAIILGKTVTTELALFHPGKTRNPHNLAHTPGGSSSGSAAAVAAGMAPLAFGTQTAGSIIRPAAFCGVTGYKPTFGMITRAGVKMQADSLDTIGVMAANVEDAALFAAALTNDHSLLVREVAASAPRIGVCRTHEWPHADADTRSAIESAAERLGRAGAHVATIALPEAFSGLAEAQRIIQTFEAARAFAYEYRAHRELLSNKLVAIIEEGNGIAPHRYRDALDVAAHCRTLMREVFLAVDVLLMPAATGEAPAGLESTGDPVFNRLATVLHLPCITLPGYRGSHGLPLGMQFVASHWGDALLLRCAAWVQRVFSN